MGRLRYSSEFLWELTAAYMALPWMRLLTVTGRMDKYVQEKYEPIRPADAFILMRCCRVATVLFIAVVITAAIFLPLYGVGFVVVGFALSCLYVLPFIATIQSDRVLRDFYRREDKERSAS